ncbi:MAG: hypothetical protein JNG88_01235 [Phycisphaerales bacterium]|nr:hypothetical protein [Phycisphaerales bacterium]
MFRASLVWRGVLVSALAAMLGIGALGCDLSPDNTAGLASAAGPEVSLKTYQRGWFWWYPPPRR